MSEAFASQPVALDMSQIPTLQSGRPEIKIIYPKVPPGLESLLRINKVFIKRKKIQLSEDNASVNVKLFEILNDKGDLLFGAKEDEEPDCFSRNFLGSIRPFEILIYDSIGNEIVHITRPCTFPSFLAVYSPPGSLIGTIIQQRGIFPKFRLKNHIEDCECEIRGPFFTISFRGRNLDFGVKFTTEESKTGKISKLWTGFLKRASTDREKFSIDFPTDLHPNIKATLIGAAFLFNCMYF